jgi:polyribonucleotide nucleotidyltransferase
MMRCFPRRTCHLDKVTIVKSSRHRASAAAAAAMSRCCAASLTTRIHSSTPFQQSSSLSVAAINGIRCHLRDAANPRRLLSTQAAVSEDEETEDDAESTFDRRRPPAPLLFTSFSRIIDGPGLQLGFGKVANQTSASVVGRSGSTVLLTTAATSSQQPQQQPQPQPAGNSSNNNNSSSQLLTVDYRQRYHGVGNIPMTNRHRRDNAVPSTAEILGARAVDRALRPCLQKERLDLDLLLPGAGLFSSSTHVSATVQSYPLLQNSPAASAGIQSRTGVAAAGHPVAMAINTASAALYHHQHHAKNNSDVGDTDAAGDAMSSSSASALLSEPVAAVCWGVGMDGTLIQDPTPYTANLIGTLLFAGTRNRAVMMEWTSFNPTSCSIGGDARAHIFPTGGGMEDFDDNITFRAGLSQRLWPDLLNFAQASLGPVLDTIEEFSIQRQESYNNGLVGILAREKEERKEEIALRISLGLSTSTVTSNLSGAATTVPSIRPPTRKDHMQEAIAYCEGQLGNSLALLFGSDGSDSSYRYSSKNDSTLLDATHHEGDALMSKKLRGKREALMQKEILRVLQEFVEANNAASGNDASEDDEGALSQKFRNDVIHALFHRALVKAAIRNGSRADGRGPKGLGWKTIRPIRAQAPALPEVVHGSALFSRGDTQVLCTVTLGPPRHGATPQDAYEPKSDYTRPTNQTNSKATTVDAARAEYNALPVGSIRFLRSQEALISDLNSRNVMADKERTGDSGSLAEVKRAFLQYDFPQYSTGELPRGSALHNRRAIGHGDLAERAILPVLPSAHDFPYAIRMTAEVTDSNGSSSMASVCGSVLALLDAGVPLTEVVAGISVGLAMEEENEDAYSLLLDITGTEDHYGAMDFKIAGTRDGVTAIQLDVKRPLPIAVLLQAMELAKSGRGVILDQMEAQVRGLRPRPEPKESAPRVEVVRFHPSRKRDLIGPGGVVLRQLEDRFGVFIDLTQEGQCLLFGSNRDLVSRAKSTVMDLVADVEEGNVYEGTILEVKDFGALVELLRNKEGILHVSEVTSEEESRNHPEGIAGFVRQHLRVGQKVEVLCIGVDPVQGSIKLSRKALLDRARQITR